MIPVAGATIEYDARLISRPDSLVADATGALRYYYYRGLKPTAKVIRVAARLKNSERLG